jgi:hypothetical protein
MATTTATTKRNIKNATTLEPLYAITLTVDGGRAIVTDVCDRRRANHAAREFNREHACDRLWASVRPVAMRFAN